MRLPEKISRRSVMMLTGRMLTGLGSLLGLGGLVRFLGYEPDPPAPTLFELGAVTDFAPDSATIAPSVPALIIRSGDSIRALSLSCSHLGCKVEARPSQLVCPCHGSRFDLEGNVLHGPATRALKALQVEVTADGKLIVYRS